MLYLEFLMAALVLVLMPGASSLYTLTIGIKYGARASIVAALSCTLYLAYSTWQASGKFNFDSVDQQSSTLTIATKAFLVTTLNPKISIFFLAFLPQFVPPQTASPVAHMLQLGVTYMLITLLVFIAYGLFAHSLRLSILRTPQTLKSLQRCFAGAFVLLGVKLALTER